MGLPKQKPTFTVDQYLAIERASPDCHEFLDGEIYAMAGESPTHGKIAFNINGLLYVQLKGKPCWGLTKDSKVRSGPNPTSRNASRGLFSYPDVIVICGEAVFHDDKKDVILNPTVIFEVLSPKTEAFDRGDKWDRYQTWNPELKDYILVSQDKPLVEKFTRRPDGGWTFDRFSDLELTLPLPSIQCELPLKDIYDRVTFPPPDEVRETEPADEV